MTSRRERAVGTSVEVHNRNHTARYVAHIFLGTGKVITLQSDWTQAHWDELEGFRQKLVREARAEATMIRKKYGIEITGINVYKENRTSVSQTVTTVNSTFHSTHNLPPETS